MTRGAAAFRHRRRVRCARARSSTDLQHTVPIRRERPDLRVEQQRAGAPGQARIALGRPDLLHGRRRHGPAGARNPMRRATSARRGTARTSTRGRPARAITKGRPSAASATSRDRCAFAPWMFTGFVTDPPTRRRGLGLVVWSGPAKRRSGPPTARGAGSIPLPRRPAPGGISGPDASNPSAIERDRASMHAPTPSLRRALLALPRIRAMCADGRTGPVRPPGFDLHPQIGPPHARSA